MLLGLSVVAVAVGIAGVLIGERVATKRVDAPRPATRVETPEPARSAAPPAARRSSTQLAPRPTASTEAARPVRPEGGALSQPGFPPAQQRQPAASRAEPDALALRDVLRDAIQRTLEQDEGFRRRVLEAAEAQNESQGTQEISPAARELLESGLGAAVKEGVARDEGLKDALRRAVQQQSREAPR